MTNSDLAQKHLQGVQKHADEDAELDDWPKEYEAYRKDAQVKPSNAMIDFRLSNGDQRAISYNHFYDVDFSPSKGMVLTFSQHRISIKGWRLNELYMLLKRHRIVWIWEADKKQKDFASDDEPTVTKITIEDLFAE